MMTLHRAAATAAVTLLVLCGTTACGKDLEPCGTGTGAGASDGEMTIMPIAHDQACQPIEDPEGPAVSGPVDENGPGVSGIPLPDARG